jgi:predicted ribonuclease YlaK
MTPNQKSMFDAFAEGYHLFVHGFAGTGKTLLSLYLGLRDILSNETVRDNVTIIRSVVPSRDMGFLPGSAKDKAKVYELPYQDACGQLFSGPNAYEALKTKKCINFSTTSFMRGLTFKNSVVYIDEIQNMADNEIHTIMTRIGEGCRVIVSGDIRQTDLQREGDRLGCNLFIRTIEKMGAFQKIEFGVEDIVRSSFVKDYIISRAAVIDEKKSC